MLEIVSQDDDSLNLTTLRDHCRVTDTEHNPALQRALDSAIIMVERWTNTFTRPTTCAGYFRGAPGPYLFEYGPVTSITSVSDETNSTTVSVNGYELDKTQGWPQLKRVAATSWLSSHAYKVTFVAGYTTCPKPLETCIYSLAATYFENREGLTPGRLFQIQASMGSILGNYRMGAM